VELAISGGFAGVKQLISLDSTGQLQASDRKRNVTITKQAPDSLVAEVGKLIIKGTSQHTEKLKRKRSTDCRDCFEYRLTITTDNKLTTARISGLPTNDSAHWALVQLLASHMEKTLATQ
jgi:hypothetical protein